MKVSIDPSWTFLEAFEAAWAAYRGTGITSRGYRNSVLKMWGNLVGHERALRELSELYEYHGSKRNLAEVMDISTSALRSIEQYFQSLPKSTSSLEASQTELIFRIGKPVPFEEDSHIEFKEVKGKNPVSSIESVADEYVVGFLNSKGGRILWGIGDSGRVVVGVPLSYEQKDAIRRKLRSKINNIAPAIDPSITQVKFHPLQTDTSSNIQLYIVEVYVPYLPSDNLYFTGRNETFVSDRYPIK